MKSAPALSPRLAAVASFVRGGSTVCDVGTDHAYLPISLCLSGKVLSAYATDVNEGPLLRAKEHIRAFGLEEKISTFLTDGLSGLGSLGCDHILICGMGGDLIQRILDDAPWIKDPNIRLILQPMTHDDTLRSYLASHGFAIIDEALAKEDRIYRILCAEYTGIPEELTEIERIFGRANLLRGGELFLEYVSFVHHVYSVRRDGKRGAGVPYEEEERLLQKMEVLLHDGR